VTEKGGEWLHKTPTRLRSGDKAKGVFRGLQRGVGGSEIFYCGDGTAAAVVFGLTRLSRREDLTDVGRGAKPYGRQKGGWMSTSLPPSPHGNILEGADRRLSTAQLHLTPRSGFGRSAMGETRVCHACRSRATSS
jgi:hypothetical protein